MSKDQNQRLAEKKRDFSNLRGLGISALAILLYLALAIAAVETFLNKSPVRWWIATIVGIYLAGTIALWWFRNALWNRVEWGTKATISFFVLLGLLALTVWLPGGLINGLTLFTLSTSTLLSLITAVAVAFSGLILFRLNYPHPAIKWVIGVLSAYGMIAFLWGIFAGTPYPTLFSGHSFWSWLPRWLQGAFISALVLVPAALIYKLVGLLQRSRIVELEKWGLQQVIALGLSLVMVVSGFTTPAGFGGAQPSAAQITEPLQKSYQELGVTLAGVKQGTQLSPKEVADRLEKLFKALEEAERQIPRDTFDLKGIIQKVGTDPIKLFQWVRDETYLVPYRGLLRGDKGVLMDRLGNSLDRAMLLYALLRSAGHRVQLARGALTEKQAKDVLQKARPIPKDGVPALKRSREIPDDLLQKVATQNQIDPTRLRKLIGNINAEQERMKEAVLQRVSEQATFIAAAVGKPKEDIRKKEEAAALEAIRDHWWLQLQQGPAWLHLDPTLPDAEPGRALTGVKENTAPEKYSDLKEDLLHMVQIQLVIGVWKQGQVSEAPVLTHKLLPAALIGERIALRHVPLAWPQDLNLFAEKNPLERLKTTVLAQRTWLPVLSVGSASIARYTFNERGDLGDTTLPGYVQAVLAGRELAHKMEEAAEVLGKTVEDMFGGIHRPKAEAPKTQPDVRSKGQQLTAEWIDYEIHSPGQPVRKIRRQIFDLIAPAARSEKKVPPPEITEARRLERGLILLGETEILPLACELSPNFVQHVLATNLLAREQVLLRQVRNPVRDINTLNQQASGLQPAPVALYGLAVTRRDWSPAPRETYVDRPNVLSYYRRLVLTAAGELLIREGFDIVANDVGVLPGTTAGPFLARMKQGVVDTMAEAVLSAAACGKPQNPSRCKVLENTSELFAQSLREGTSWAVIRPDSEATLDMTSIPVDARVRILQDLSAGFVVVSPRKPLKVAERKMVAWWRVNPRSGHTLGIGPGGAGQTATEKVVTTVVSSMGIIAVCAYTVLSAAALSCAGESGEAGKKLDDCERKNCIKYAEFAPGPHDEGGHQRCLQRYCAQFLDKGQAGRQKEAECQKKVVDDRISMCLIFGIPAGIGYAFGMIWGLLAGAIVVGVTGETP